MHRGRKASIPKDVIINTILNYKEEIVINNKIVSKSASIWQKISAELSYSGHIKATSLYTFVTCNRYNLHQLLDITRSETDLYNKNQDESVQSTDTSYDTDNDTSISNGRVFVISLTQKEYQSLLVTKVYGKRTCVRFKSGEWEDVLAQKIWNETRITCGINFKGHYLTENVDYGHIDGKCHCGSIFRGVLRNYDTCVKIECTLTTGTGQCGKRNLRGDRRKKVGEILSKKSVEHFRAEEAMRLMSPGEPEAPLFYTANVLHKAKHEKIASDYLNPDPIKALEILKTTALGKNVVHGIGQDPFYVIYFTSHQLQIYKQLLKLEHITLCIDASGVRVPRLNRPNGTSSHYIFLYHAVINSSAGQFSVSQFLTEIHTSTFIRFWLMEWCRIGAQHPKEVVTDASRALLTAVIKEFTSYATIERYADACRNTVPDCYVRVDVAHFMKTYSDVLKSALRPVRTFYLAVIGQIVLCRQVEDARKILKALLIVSQCELEGNLQGTNITSDCETQKQFLEHLITGKEIIIDEELINKEEHISEKSISILDENEEMEISSNWWSKWGKEINCEIEDSISQNGTRANAHYSPHIAKKLLRDIGTIPLWSNICTDKFGYGRVPASSAPVESEFNKLKNLIINKSLRADKFVEEHIKYLIGRVIIADANISREQIPVENKNYEVEDNSNNSDFVQQDMNLQKTTDNKRDMSLLPETVKTRHSVSIFDITDSTDNEFDHCIDVNMSDKENVDETENQPKTKKTKKDCTSDLESSLTDPEITALREMENWRGKVTGQSKKRKARYLGERMDEVSDILKSKPKKKIPLLKNGSCLTLQKMNLRNKSIVVTNTCAFDSLCQSVLIACYDIPNIQGFIEQKTSIPLFKMIMNILKTGITSKTYRMRADILLDIFGTSVQSSINLVNCVSSVAYVISKTLIDCPCIEHQIFCLNGCTDQRRMMNIILLEDSKLTEDSFDQAIKDYITLTSRVLKPCHICCLDTTAEVIAAGPLLFIEIYNKDGKEKCYTLQQLPQQLKILIDNREETFMLLAVIDYKGPQNTRTSNKELGHFTTICLRQKKTWIQYDNLHDKEERKHYTFKTNPQILIYTLNKSSN